MAHSEDLEKIKQKIRGLMSKTVDRGCTHSEAEAAMLMVGKLLEQYNISMDTVDVAEEKCITIVCGAGTLKRSLHSLYSSAIAVLCDVRHWMQKTRVEQTFVYFGFEPDVQMAQYLFKLLDSAIKYETNQFKLTSIDYLYATAHRKSLSNSFQNAMAIRLAERLMILAHARKSAQQAPSSSTALVVIAKGQRVLAEYEKLGMKKLQKVTINIRQRHAGSAAAGRKAGDKIDLSRPIGGKEYTQID